MPTWQSPAGSDLASLAVAGDPNNDVLRAELNEIASGIFWPEFFVGGATVPANATSVTASFAGPDSTPAAPPWAIGLVDAATLAPVRAAGGIVTGQGVVSGVINHHCAARSIEHDGEYEHPFSTEPACPDAPVRLVDRAIGAIVYTRRLKSFGWPTDWSLDPKSPAHVTGRALLDKILVHVKQTINLLPHAGGDQFVLVNESLSNGLGWSQILGSKTGVLSRRFSPARIAKNPRALAAWLVKRKSAIEGFFHRCLTQNQRGQSRWLDALNVGGRPSGAEYIVDSFKEAYAARPDAVYLLNDFGHEDLARPKSVAYLVLATYLKHALRGGAETRLGAGLQMHLTPSSMPYESVAKRLAFLRGLLGILRAMHKLHLPVYVTEMAARMPGNAVAAFEVRRSRAAVHQALLQAQAAMLAGDTEALAFAAKLGFPQGSGESVQAWSDRFVAGYLAHLDGKASAAVQRATHDAQAAENARAKKRGRRPETAHLPPEAADALRVHAYDVSAEFPKDRGWTNQNVWGATPTYVSECSPMPVPSAVDKEVQKTIFRDVALACLSQPNCADINFWEMLDRPILDESIDLVGHLCDPAVGAPGPSVGASPSWFRKPAYFGVLQAAIEAGLIKGKLRTYAASQGRTSRTIVMPSFRSGD